MSIAFAPRALVDIELAIDDLRDWRAGAAERFVERLHSTLARLEFLPHTGTRYEPPNPALAEMRASPVRRDYGYTVFYQPTADGMRVLRVLHGSRNVAAIFAPDPPV